MDLLVASCQTYSNDCCHIKAQYDKSKSETSQATQELALHMRSCMQRSQRFTRDTDALKKQINNLTKDSIR